MNIKYCIEIDKDKTIVEVKDVYELYEKVNMIQNLDTLLDSAICFGTSLDHADIEKLKKLINDYENKELKAFDCLEIHLSVCDIVIKKVEFPQQYYYTPEKFLL